MLRQVGPNWPDLEDVTVVPSRKGSLGYQLLPPFLHLDQGVIPQWHSLRERAQMLFGKDSRNYLQWGLKDKRQDVLMKVTAVGA